MIYIHTNRKRGFHKTLLLSFRLVETDAKLILQRFLKKHPTAWQYPSTKESILSIFREHYAPVFPETVMDELLSWLFCISENNSFIVKEQDGMYIINPNILSIKPGPKGKQV